MIVRDRRSEEIDHHPAAGVVFGELEVWCQDLVGCPDGEVWRLEESGEAIDEDQAGDSFWMRRGEGYREDAAADVRDDGRLFRTDGIEDGGDVLHELLERRQGSGRDRIRESGAALVEHDQAPERGEPFAERGEGRHIPLGVLVTEPLIEQQEVGGPMADDLVRQMQVAEAGVAGLGNHRTMLLGDPGSADLVAVVTLGAAR